MKTKASREWKRGRIAGRGYARQCPDKPVWSRHICPDPFRTDFDDGWDQGQKEVLKLLGKGKSALL